MIQEYYLITETERKGPYDLMALVRKIRNGSLAPDSLVQQEETTPPRPAQEWEELSEFFLEKKDEASTPAEPAPPPSRSFSDTLRSGTNFLSQNYYSTVFSGLLVLFILLLILITGSTLSPALASLSYGGCFILGYFFVSCYMLSVLRMARGQPVDFTYIYGKVAPVLGPLFGAAILVSIPAIIGIALITCKLHPVLMLIGVLVFIIPGLFTITIHAFIPLLMLDKGYGLAESAEQSRKAAFKGGFESVGILYGLFVINFIAGLCILLPMAVTLPITMGALAEMYEEKFG